MYLFLISNLFFYSAFAHNGIMHNDNPQKFEKVVIDYTPVAKIIERSCINCHSIKNKPVGFYTQLPFLKSFFEARRKEAMTHLDFTNGYPPRGHGNIRDDLVAMHRSVVRNEMPPQIWNWWHQEHSLSESDRARLLEWIDKQLNRLNP